MADPAFPPIDVPGDGKLYAKIHTTQGVMVAELYEEQTPNTVASFVGLATGSIDWTDPKSGQGMQGSPMYDGVRFHRVIPGFMVQVGDPQARYPELKGRWGTGNPGYRFSDEIVPALKHDRPGTLSMANSGPNTNGSQIFITEVPTPHLDGRHAVFGHVVAGVDVITKIANVDTDGRDCPREDQLIERIEILRSAAPPS